MRITALEVAGYGVWTGLRIESLSEGLNVVYGPNEAGKTTLLEFIRSMFYGFAPRQKYLPPVHGGRPGGTVKLDGPHGKFEIGRFANSLADGETVEQLTLTAPDGTHQGEHFLKVLLSNVDEPVFNNVFAVGLREIQELATLGDTEAAELLYSLSAGLDRVSLVDVLRELDSSRNRLLDASGGPCQVVQLLAERERLRQEIEEIGSINRRYAHLAAEQRGLHEEVSRLQEESNHTERLARVMDLALTLRDRWARRAALDDELSALAPAKGMPEDAVARLDAINARLAKHQRRLERLAQLRQEAKREFAALPVNEALSRQAVRIEALKEQEPWIVQLRTQIGELQGEAAQSEAALAAERQRLGFSAEPVSLPSLSAGILRTLRSAARLLEQHRHRLGEAEQAAASARQTANALAGQIASALAVRGQGDLSSAMDRAGNLVSQLRRRASLDERLDQLAGYRTELEERTRRLLDRQMLPAGALIGIGAVFILGVTLALAGLFIPTVVGSAGYALVVLGVAVSVAAGMAKVMLERSNARRFDGCQKQLGLLQSQMQQAREERDGVDAQLAAAGGGEKEDRSTVCEVPSGLPRQIGSAPVFPRLDAAEKELAALEELAPLDARRAAARHEAEAAAVRAREAKGQLRAARRRWHDALSAAGLPETLRPKQLRRLARHGGRLAEMQRRRRSTPRRLAPPRARIGRSFGADCANGGRGRSSTRRRRSAGAVAAAFRCGRSTAGRFGPSRCPAPEGPAHSPGSGETRGDC